MFKLFKKTKDLIDKDLLLFVGSPRTGSTLLGQIINYHPNCLVSNEVRFANKVIESDKDINTILNEIYNEAMDQYEQSLENDKKFGKTIDTYQPKWKSMTHLLNKDSFKKKDITLLGDKKAGGLAKVYMKNGDLTIGFFNKNKNIKLIQIIRHPIDSSKSLMKSHGVKTLNDACDYILKTTIAGNELIQSTENDSYQIYYEDLLQNPEDELKNLFKFLKIKLESEWINGIKTILNTQTSIYTEEEMLILRDLLKTNDLQNRGIKIFERYLY